MLTQLEVFTPKVITPPLVAPTGLESTDPIQVLAIDGLGPVAAEVSTTGYSSVDGEFLTGARVGKRNIVITFRLNPDWTVAQSPEILRAALYKYFMPKKPVTLQFTSSHMEQVSIQGTVESFEPNIFTKDPIIQVSIICPSPDFVGTTTNTLSGLTVTASSAVVAATDYIGTENAGFLFTLLTDAFALQNKDVRIIKTTPDATKLFLASAIVDQPTFPSYFEWSTYQGGKYLKFINTNGDDSSAHDLIKFVSPGSTWFSLEPGPNTIKVIFPTANIPWILTYQTRYGGI